MTPRILPTALALAAITAYPAAAEMRTLVTAGLWSAFGGTVENQPPVCGITTQGGDGRHITIAQSAGETGLTFSLDKPSWTIPAATALDIAVQFDHNPPLLLASSGAAQRVWVALPFEQTVGFMRAFRRGVQIQVTFPKGNEPAWTGGLSGSGRAIDAFNTCRQGLTASAVPTQPVLPAAGTVAPPTQPVTVSQPVPPVPGPPIAATPAIVPGAAPPIPPAPKP